MLYSRPQKVAEPELPENKEKFHKAKDIHSKMAIYFDENFYSKNRCDENCYKYLYLIFYMLSCKKKYFHNYEDYDQYSQFAANTIYMRFIKKQNHGERIKSVLNYAKATLYPLKVMYQNSEFREIANPEKYDTYAMQQTLRNNVQQSYYGQDLEEAILDTFQDIPSIVWKVVMESPYRNDAIMRKRVYISCVLTLLKSFTLSNYNQERINKRNETSQNKISEDVICKMFNKEREESTTVWRLDPSMGDYIQILANKVRKKIAEEINEDRNSMTLNDDTLDAILMSAWEGTTYANSQDDGDE